MSEINHIKFIEKELQRPREQQITYFQFEEEHIHIYIYIIMNVKQLIFVVTLFIGLLMMCGRVEAKPCGVRWNKCPKKIQVSI